MALCKIGSMHIYTFISWAANLHPPSSSFAWSSTHIHTHTHTLTRSNTYHSRRATLRSCDYISSFCKSHYFFLRKQLVAYELTDVTKAFGSATYAYDVLEGKDTEIQKNRLLHGENCICDSVHLSFWKIMVLYQALKKPLFENSDSNLCVFRKTSWWCWYHLEFCSR